MEVRWTVQAADDLVAIRDFIARISPVYARHVVERLFEAVHVPRPQLRRAAGRGCGWLERRDWTGFEDGFRRHPVAKAST